MSHNNTYEHTTESMYNQEWKAKLVVGYGAGIYIGQGPEAYYLAKASDKEVNTAELMDLYIRICKEHNEAIRAGVNYKKKKPFFIVRWYRAIALKFTPEFDYNYPADIDKDPDQNKYQ